MFLVPVNRNLSELSRSLDRFFDDGFFGEPRDASATLRSPALDVIEGETAYTVKLDMPGVTKDAVKVNIDGRRVSVDAEQRKDDEKKDEQKDEQKNDEQKDQKQDQQNKDQQKQDTSEKSDKNQQQQKSVA